MTTVRSSHDPESDDAIMFGSLPNHEEQLTFRERGLHLAANMQNGGLRSRDCCFNSATTPSKMTIE